MTHAQYFQAWKRSWDHPRERVRKRNRSRVRRYGRRLEQRAKDGPEGMVRWRPSVPREYG